MGDKFARCPQCNTICPPADEYGFSDCICGRSNFIGVPSEDPPPFVHPEVWAVGHEPGEPEFDDVALLKYLFSRFMIGVFIGLTIVFGPILIIILIGIWRLIR